MLKWALRDVLAIGQTVEGIDRRWTWPDSGVPSSTCTVRTDVTMHGKENHGPVYGKDQRDRRREGRSRSRAQKGPAVPCTGPWAYGRNIWKLTWPRSGQAVASWWYLIQAKVSYLAWAGNLKGKLKMCRAGRGGWYFLLLVHWGYAAQGSFLESFLMIRSGRVHQKFIFILALW